MDPAPACGGPGTSGRHPLSESALCPSSTPIRALIKKQSCLERLCLIRGVEITDLSTLESLKSLTHLILRNCTTCLAREVLRKPLDTWPRLRMLAIELEDNPWSQAQEPPESLLTSNTSGRMFRYYEDDLSILHMPWNEVVQFKPTVMELYSNRLEILDGLTPYLSQMTSVTALALGGTVDVVLLHLGFLANLCKLKINHHGPPSSDWCVSAGVLPFGLTSLSAANGNGLISLTRGNMRGLRELSVKPTRFTLMDWSSLRLMRELTTLELVLCAKDDPSGGDSSPLVADMPEELGYLRALTHLHIRANGIRPARLTPWSTLCTMTQLRGLSLNHVVITEACRSLCQLRSLKLEGSQCWTPLLLGDLSRLRALHVRHAAYNVELKAGAYKAEGEPGDYRSWSLHLAGLTALEELHLNGKLTHMLAGEEPRIQADLPNLPYCQSSEPSWFQRLLQQHHQISIVLTRT